MFKESDAERAPKFVLLPTGERANRMFVAGTLTETANIGSQTDYWQGRIVDPTNTFFVYAGQYQPDAMAQLESIDPPEYVAVVGKPRTYETDDGELRSSLTIEQLTIVNKDTRDRWVLDTAMATKKRIEAAQHDESPEDARKAAKRYDPDHFQYRVYVRNAYNDLDGGQPQGET